MRIRLLWIVALILAASCLTPARSEVVLRVVMADDWAGTPTFLDAVRDFERSNSGVRINVEPVQFEFILEGLESYVAKGDPPDVVQFHAFAAAAIGLAEPLDDLWADAALSEAEFLPGSISDIRWGTSLYGVPLDANAMAMLYNRTLMRGAASIPSRYTFEELERAAQALAEGDRGRPAIAVPSSTWAAFGWIRANGGGLVDVDANGEATFTFDRRENIEALAFLARLVRRGLALPPTGGSGDRIDAYALFRSGSTAMHASGSWDVVAIEGTDVRWGSGVAPMPRGTDGRPGTGGSVLGGSSLLVPKGADERELGFSFMTHLIKDEYALRFAREEGRLPTRSRVFDDPYFGTPPLSVFREQMKTAMPFLLEAFPREHEIFREALLSVLEGKALAGDALRRAQRHVS